MYGKCIIFLTLLLVASAQKSKKKLNFAAYKQENGIKNITVVNIKTLFICELNDELLRNKNLDAADHCCAVYNSCKGLFIKPNATMRLNDLTNKTNNNLYPIKECRCESWLEDCLNSLKVDDSAALNIKETIKKLKDCKDNCIIRECLDIVYLRHQGKYSKYVRDNRIKKSSKNKRNKNGKREKKEKKKQQAK